MFVYLLVLLLIIYCVFVFDIKEKKNGKDIWERGIVLVLVLLAGFRNHVGSDSIKYEYNFYNDLLTLKDIFSFKYLDEMNEPLWTLLMSICKSIFGKFVFFQFLHAILFNVLLFRFYKKITDKVFTALLITFLVFWFGFSFEILRQSLCIAIYLNAVLLLREKKIKSYIILSIVMFGIHNFSIILSIITPMVLFINKKILYPLLVFVVFFAFFYVNETIMNLFFLQVEDMGTDNMQDKIDSYINYGNYGYANYNINGILWLVVLSILFPLSIVLLNKGKSKRVFRNKETNLDNGFKSNLEEMLNRFIMLYMVFGVLSSKLIIFFRFQQYFLPFVVITVVYVLFKKKKKSLLTAVMIFSFSIFTIDAVVTLYKPSPLISSPVSYDSRYFPYTSVFQTENQLRKRMWGI